MHKDFCRWAAEDPTLWARFWFRDDGPEDNHTAPLPLQVSRVDGKWAIVALAPVEMWRDGCDTVIVRCLGSRAMAKEILKGAYSHHYLADLPEDLQLESKRCRAYLAEHFSDADALDVQAGKPAVRVTHPDRGAAGSEDQQ